MSAKRRIMIVGNGEIAERASNEIDAADRVVCFNDCRSFGMDGSRADVLLRHPGDDIAITGFSHAGWDGHSFAAEKRLVDLNVSFGRLRRMASTTPILSSQGA